MRSHDSSCAHRAIFNMLYSTVDDSNKNISKKQHIIQKSEEVARRKKEIFIEMKIIPKDLPRYNDNYRADVFMERKLTW